MKRNVFLSVMVLGTIGAGQLTAQPSTVLTVKADKLVAPVQPTMWGIFFEDINFGADSKAIMP